MDCARRRIDPIVGHGAHCGRTRTPYTALAALPIPGRLPNEGTAITCRCPPLDQQCARAAPQQPAALGSDRAASAQPKRVAACPARTTPLSSCTATLGFTMGHEHPCPTGASELGVIRSPVAPDAPSGG